MDTFNVQPTNTSYTEDISLNEYMQILAPLLEFNTTYIPEGPSRTEDGFPLVEPSGNIDLQFMQGHINTTPNSSDSLGQNDAIDPQNENAELPGLDNPRDICFDIESNMSNDGPDEDGLEYQRAKIAFEAEENPTLESQIRFKKAQEKEHLRTTRIRLREALSQSENDISHPYSHSEAIENPGIQASEDIEEQNTGQEGTFDLFCSDDEAAPIQDLANHSIFNNEAILSVCTKEDAPKPKKVAKAKSGTRQDELSKKWGEASNDKIKKAKQKRGNTGVQKSKIGSKPKKRESKNKEPTRLNFDSLFTSNLFSNAKRNTQKKAIPGFSAGDKSKALREIIGSIPTDEEIDMRSLSEHKKAIMDSILKFTKRPRADHEGGWRHPNMKTSLFHYQLLGVAFMRDRENASTAPRGGFLCDEMGFGKTIQAIANMVDGKALLDRREPAITLIVAPTHLVSHWQQELMKHIKPGELGYIFPYHGAGKPNLDLIIHSGGDRNIGVIITTYGEVRSSCNFPVPQFSSKDDQKSWRLANCEAHEIKNHTSKISQAVRLLSAKFRWVITGTPIHNYVKEFYPYFNFLQVPGLENHDIFHDKIVQNDVDHRRLLNCLRAYMLRRTHAETLFGRPILKLPGIDENTIVVKFSLVERALYRKIISGFLDKNLHSMRTVEGISNYLTLLLMLRMFTSHLLIPHSAIRPFLTPQFMLEMHPEVENSAQLEDVEMYNSLKTIFEDPIPSSDPQIKEPQHTDLLTMFKSVANSPSARPDVMNCIVCERKPREAFILSCMHICCSNCLPKLSQPVEEQFMCLCGSIIRFKSCFDVQSLCRSKAGSKGKGAKPRDINGREEGCIDWASSVGHMVPGAKLRAVRSFISQWLQDSPGTKITIFTQFIGMMSILCSLCETEGWGYTTVLMLLALCSNIIDRCLPFMTAFWEIIPCN
ncbi:hypothetical protein McanCB49686_006419 [Microsporum canis]